MGEYHFVICRDCKYTCFVADYELIDFIEEHGGHKIGIFPYSIFEDHEQFEKTFRRFMGWPLEETE